MPEFPATSGNLRDLGGLPTTDGRRVRDGMLLRCEAPVTLDAESLRRLAAIPVRLVYDLRSPGEDVDLPAIWASDAQPEVVRVELFPRHLVEGDDLLEPLMEDLSGEASRRYMFGFYAACLDRMAEGCLADVVERVTVGGQTPALIHCTAGQDRTGMLVALMLLALGVPREVVVEDYMRTLGHFGPDRVLEWFRERYPEDALGWSALEPFVVAPEYVEVTLDLLLERWGAIDDYLAHAGIDPDALERLRDTLLH